MDFWKRSSLGQIISIAFLCVVGLFITSVMFGSFFTVSQNERTVVTRFGELQYVAGPGLHFKLPFTDSASTSYSIGIETLSPGKGEVGDGVNTYTIDNQEVDVVYTVFYRVPSENIPYIYEHVQDYKALLQKMTVDRLKAEVGKVNITTVAEKRGELRDAIKEILVRDSGSLRVEVTDFQLTDLQYTKSYRAAVEAAATQKAGIETKEYERQQAQKTAEKTVIEAEARANSVRAEAKGAADARLLQATAESKAIQLQGEATATAIKAQGEALKSNPEMVELRKAEKWNGALPQQMFANTPMTYMAVDPSQVVRK